jgi:hypothetical protein
MNEVGLIIAALLFFLFGVPTILGLLGLWFWRLSQPAALEGRARWVRLGGLTVLAGILAGVFYAWILVITQPIPGAHAAAKSMWPWAHEHPAEATLLFVSGIVIALALTAGRRLAALSFGLGALLAVGAVGGRQYLAQRQQDRAQIDKEEFRAHLDTNWQRAVTDSFQLQVDRRGDVYAPELTARPPQYPGGAPALQQAFATLLDPSLVPAESVFSRAATVEVTFFVEADGRIRLPHVTRGLGAGYDEEAVRVVRLLPAFVPARHSDGDAIAVVWKVEVPFRK